MYIRAALLGLLVVFIGCNSASYRDKLTSQLPRGDGSMIEVECISEIKHTIASISPTLQPQPQVTIIMDERTIVVQKDKVLLNGQEFRSLLSNVTKVRIEITEDKFSVLSFGESGVKLDDPLPAQ